MRAALGPGRSRSRFGDVVGNCCSERGKGEFSALQQGVFYPGQPWLCNPSPEAAPGLWSSVPRVQGSASPVSSSIFCLSCTLFREISAWALDKRLCWRKEGKADFCSLVFSLDFLSGNLCSPFWVGLRRFLSLTTQLWPSVSWTSDHRF